MDFDNINQLSEVKTDDSSDFKELIGKYLEKYHWFIISIVIMIVISFFKLRYEVPKYSVSAKILIKEQEKGGSINDLSAFGDLGLFGSNNNSLENEIQILTSRGLITNVVKELRLNLKYLIEDSKYNREQFPNFPIVANINAPEVVIDQISSNFEIIINSKKSFELITFDGESLGSKEFGRAFTADLGNDNGSNIQELTLELNQEVAKNVIGKSIHVEITPVNLVVNDLMGRIFIEPVNEKMSKVLMLYLDVPVIPKGEAILNNLIEQYNADGVNDKTLIAQTTIDFLDLRLGLLSTELAAIEGTAEQFKSKNRMVDVNAGADIYLQSSSNTESDLVGVNTKLELLNYMSETLETTNDQELLPGNIGLAEPSIIDLISGYNELVLQRNRILKSSSIKNPIIINIDSQLSVIKSNLKNSLNGLKSSSEIQLRALNQQSGRISSRIASVPKNERQFKEIVRQQETKNALYLFLLQKREESILSNAVKIEKAKIIDSAYSFGVKVSPKKKVYYLIAILLGLIFPTGIIYVKNLLDNKVHDENDLKSLKIPYVGDIPLSASKKPLYITENDNSAIAEAFRYIRTNLGFMLSRKGLGKTVFVTSTQSGEGKTYTSINLALSLAMSGKKTLLVGMDLRAPKIELYLGLSKEKGISNFIVESDLDPSDIVISETGTKNFHLCSSGDIPPNPVEMLMSVRVSDFFEYVKSEYDYIIVDTAPVGMVTDTIQISEYSDLCLYVVKANFLDKRLLHIPEKLFKERKLPNMALLINGSDHSKGSYGYGYGYGKKTKKSWFKSRIDKNHFF